jgi:hypothetical protein
MNWIKYWFAVFIIELFIWAYVIILHFEIKELQKIRAPKPRYQKEHKVIVKTKKDIMRG